MCRAHHLSSSTLPDGGHAVALPTLRITGCVASRTSAISMRNYDKSTRRANHQKSVNRLLQKEFSSRLIQITLTTPRIPSHQEGRIAIVTDVGCGMRWTRQRRARECSQGGLRPVSDRTARRRPALKRLRRNFGRQHMSRAKGFGGGSRGRQRRVVLAPVAGVKLAEIGRARPGFGESSIRQRRRPKEFGSGKSAL